MKRFRFPKVPWLYFTRALGTLALIYEVVVDKVDKPSVMVVVGALILGTEAFSRDRSSKE